MTKDVVRSSATVNKVKQSGVTCCCVILNMNSWLQLAAMFRPVPSLIRLPSLSDLLSPD